MKPDIGYNEQRVVKKDPIQKKDPAQKPDPKKDPTQKPDPKKDPTQKPDPKKDPTQKPDPKKDQIQKKDSKKDQTPSVIKNFIGDEITIFLRSGTNVKGILEAVVQYELVITTPRNPIIVMKHAIDYIELTGEK